MRNKYYLTAFMILIVSSYLLQAQSAEWIAPDSADNLINPYIGDEAAIQEGKSFFKMICVVCHGAQGKGDGVNAPALAKQPANLSSQKVQQQSDGALFWKISEGNPPMLSFKSSLTEDQRWKLVSYVRQLRAPVDQKVAAVSAKVPPSGKNNNALKNLEQNTVVVIDIVEDIQKKQGTQTIGLQEIKKQQVPVTEQQATNQNNSSSSSAVASPINVQSPQRSSGKTSSVEVFWILVGLILLLLFGMMLIVIYLLLMKIRIIAEEY